MTSDEEPGAADERIDLEAVRQFFGQGIPFQVHLGMELRRVDRGTMAVALPFRPEFIGDPTRPALHGGVLSTLVDAAGGGAAWTLTRPGDRLATIDLRVDYLLPGRPVEVVATAKVIRIGNRVAVSSIEVIHPDEPERPIAVGKAVYTIKRARGAP